MSGNEWPAKNKIQRQFQQPICALCAAGFSPNFVRHYRSSLMCKVFLKIGKDWGKEANGMEYGMNDAQTF